jgi:hypothetical protein
MKATPQQDQGEYFLGAFCKSQKKTWLVRTPTAEDAVERVGRVAEAKEVKEEVQVGLSQGRHQRLGPARNLKAIFSPLAQETRARMVIC